MTRRILALSVVAALFAAASVPALADRDAVQFGENIHATRGHEVHDAVCFFCNVDIPADSKVTGDIVVFFGDVHVAGAVEHDVVNFFGSVKADDNASISHDLVSMFGGVRLGQNVSVGGDMVAMFGAVHEADSASVGKDRVVEPGWVFFVPLLFVCLVVIFIVHEFRARRHRFMMMHYPPPPML